MDRRTVLAFALIGLILVLMPYYMKLVQGDPPPVAPTRVAPSDPGLPRQTPSPEPDAPSSLSASRPSSSAPPPSQVEPPPSSGSQPSQSFQARDIVIDTDLFQGIISTRGGVITSWKLKNHLDLDGNWLELIGANGAGLGVHAAGVNLNHLEFVPDVERLSLTGDSQDLLTLTARGPRGTVEKRLRFQGNRYRVEVSLRAEGLSRDERFGLTWQGALADTESNAGASAGFYEGDYEQVVTYLGGEIEFWDIDRIQSDEAPPGGQITWIGVRNKYFLAAIIPDAGRFELALAGASSTDALGNTLREFDVQILDDEDRIQLDFGAYVGPISYDHLRQQNRSLDGEVRELDLDEFVDYGPSFLRTILKPVTILILKAFHAIHALVPNYGVVIILFSLLVKIIFFSLTHKSLESTSKMQQLQPKIAELRERYAKDQQKMNEAMMRLYREEKINPIGGCLPMVLQMPILFSLFSLFRGTIELRQAGFALWIDDLSKPDTIPLGGFDLHLLPLLMGVSMFIQQKMMMKDPKQAALVYIMPVFLTYIFWTMSSGLVFYYTLFNVLTLAQQIIMERTKKILGTS